MIEKIGTFALVTFLTVLVWIWAEHESLSEERITAQVELIASPVIHPPQVQDQTWKGAVLVRLRGSNASLAEARRVLLGSALKLEPGVGGMPATAGEHTLDLRRCLRECPDLSSIGVALVETEPSTLRVRLTSKN
jgi:hypothetical protein